ncbi:HAD family hydrolase [Micavibrio aeruginosavorus]|uniref:phosphoglycolate phosphatase n=1 Tax=Micavibrio aeruginosavorus (strain ARL-13) TaxID=856793 RepID=G2KRN9_MICAA|nr:HAD family hydrolase [Micavibrio aeruginosavorus]AEP09601.1 HAD-superhydrolase, subIA, variant 3 family protein [Micavibrio aeruginosavorus ARL-13]
MGDTLTQNFTPASRPAGVFFDWDGTLVDTIPLLREMYARLQNHFGQPPFSDDQFFDNLKYSARELFPRLYGSRSDEAFKIWYENVEKLHLAHIAPMNGAGEVLAHLAAAGVPMGVVSNKRHAVLMKEIEHLGWSKYFASVVGAGEAGRDKPAPDPLILALNQAGLKAGPNIWYIGDTESDLLCSRDAGCASVFLRFDGRHDSAAQNNPPTHIVGDNQGLLSLLKQNL